MKALSLLIILLLFYFLNGQKGYSENEFIEYLQESELYDIIQSVKYYYGDDVAINFCEELTQSSFCAVVVRVYMTNSGSSPIDPKTSIEYLLEKTKASEYFKIEIIKLYKEVDNKSKFLISIIVSSYNILIKNMKEIEILTLIKKMILKKIIR